MKNKSVAYIFIALYLLLAIAACTNGSFDVVKEGSTAALTDIAVAGTPAKTLYFLGDEFDGSGLTVTATYEDGSSRAVTGYSVIGFSTESINMGQEMTISYTEGGITKTAQVTYYVAKAEARPTEKPVKLSEYQGTLFDGTSDKGTYYAFGDFPQTVGSSENTYTDNPVYRGHYLGSDGYFYEMCTENAYESGYTYSDKTEAKKADAPSIRYFKVEPIKWRVLNTKESGNRILLAESILTANIHFYGSYDDRDTIHPNNYEHSNIRAYLNGISYQFETGTNNTWENSGFLQLAFTEKAQKLIATTVVDNSEATTIPDEVTQEDLENIWNGGKNPYARGKTNNKIFLLSEKEATTKDYGFTAYNESGQNNSRIRKTTDYALANHAFQSNTAGYGGWWWLRSPSYYSSNHARGISIDGGGSARNNNDVYSGGGGVVPALSISIGN